MTKLMEEDCSLVDSDADDFKPRKRKRPSAEKTEQAKRPKTGRDRRRANTVARPAAQMYQKAAHNRPDGTFVRQQVACGPRGEAGRAQAISA